MKLIHSICILISISSLLLYNLTAFLRKENDNLKNQLTTCQIQLQHTEDQLYNYHELEYTTKLLEVSEIKDCEYINGYDHCIIKLENFDY